MKRKSFITLLVCSASALVSQNVKAQNGLIAVNNIKENAASNYMAFSSFAPKISTIIVYPAGDKTIESKENSNVRSLYLSSEQYVFDNLGSLKKFFSVNDIYFDLDQSAIRPDAIPVMDKLVNLMIEHPEISVAATAYSDTRFSKYNAQLAKNRAQSAIDYLVSKGIGADRLSIEKHGRPQTANPCNNDPSCSLNEQQLNRKAEFNIVYNGVNLGQIN